MRAVPIELPLKASEAAAVADLVFQFAEGKHLNDDLRGRLQNRIGALGLTSIRPYPRSLQLDPVHSSAYYLAVDAISGDRATPLLLRIALASTPASSLFPDAILIGRMRPGGGREVVVNAASFDLTDHANLKTYAEKVDRSALPRPLGPQPSITIESIQPDVSFPAAFDAFRSVLKTTGANLASIAGSGAYSAGIWTAIRAGWREGYITCANRLQVSGTTQNEVRQSIEAARKSIALASECTRFTTEVSTAAWPGSELKPDEYRWIAGEFTQPFRVGTSTYNFTESEVEGLVDRLGPSLRVHEELFDAIQLAKARGSQWKHFDFEVALDCAPMTTSVPTSAKDLIFHLHWLKQRGRPAQLVAPALSADHQELRLQARELSAVALHFGALLSVRLPSGTDLGVVSIVGPACQGRLNIYVAADPEPLSSRADTRESILSLAAQLRG